MTATEEKTQLLDEFAGRIQRHFPTSVWSSLQQGSGTAEFGTATRSVLCVQMPEAGPLSPQAVQATLSQLAASYGGCIDPSDDGFAMISFSRPKPGLRMALALQRRTSRARLRMGLLRGRCNVARGQADGNRFLLLLGRERARVKALAARAAPGTVQVCPDLYGVIDDCIAEDELGSCIALAEFEGDTVAEVTLTLAPDSSDELSTFAGLGLT
ncbi:hypothetical protein [Ramlibacter sp.]|uniref:hypothetical protein n=1 Tax=Ramlibacter sp. TaxID=1917967 RepID=UPI002FC808EA